MLNLSTAMSRTTLEDLSSIAGWMSIACWIVVYTPQIWENYNLKSGEGLSVAFIVLWLAGDLTNLAGGAMAHLLPTMIILACYYIICDVILLFQVYHYRRRTARVISQAASESSPLLRERALSAASLPPPAQPKPLLPPRLEYPLLLSFVLAFGVGAWVVNAHRQNGTVVGTHPGGHKHHGHGHGHGHGHEDQVELEWKSQLLGWSSALLYFVSRVPQIVKNYQTRCAGLSLAMFFFSISGNVTYVASIMFHSVERTYLVANASWLAGSLSTIFLDIFVLAQFAIYSYQDKRQVAVVDDA